MLLLPLRYGENDTNNYHHLVDLLDPTMTLEQKGKDLGGGREVGAAETVDLAFGVSSSQNQNHEDQRPNQ